MSVASANCVEIMEHNCSGSGTVEGETDLSLCYQCSLRPAKGAVWGVSSLPAMKFHLVFSDTFVTDCHGAAKLLCMSFSSGACCSILKRFFTNVFPFS